jgi:hypothetical protein
MCVARHTYVITAGLAPPKEVTYFERKKGWGVLQSESKSAVADFGISSHEGNER